MAWPVAFVNFARAAVAFHARKGVVPGVATPSRNQQNRPKTPRAMYLFLHELFERGPNIVRETEKKTGKERKDSPRVIPGQSLASRKECISPVTTPHRFISMSSNTFYRGSLSQS